MIRLTLQIPLAAFLCAAASAQTASLTTSSLAPGAPQTSSANYTIDTSLDPTGGVVATSANYTLKPGYAGQLYDVVSLAVTPQLASVNELGTNQLEAVATMDDATTLPLAATDVTWSVVSGPLDSVSTSGVAQTSVVFADTLATARGEYESLQDNALFTVVNSIPDNFGPVAGDGLDDEWQFEFFDEDNDDMLDPGEAANAAPGSDPDMDHQDNTFESLAGYDPTDRLSLFTLTIDGRSGSTADLRLSKVIAGTRYRIQKSTDLGQVDPFTTIETLLPGSEQLDQPVADTNATDAATYYQVLLDEAP